MGNHFFFSCSRTQRLVRVASHVYIFSLVMGRLSRYFLLSVLPGRRKAWHGHAQCVNMMYSFLYWILKGNKQATGHNQHSLLLQFCHNEKALREGVFEEKFQFKHHFKSKISSLRLNLFSFHGVGHKK